MGMIATWIDTLFNFWEKTFTLHCRECNTDNPIQDCYLEDIEPMEDGRDLYTFVCPICNNVQVSYIRG